MDPGSAIGESIPRKEAFDKVTGRAMYNSDFLPRGTLEARFITSPYAHARIVSLDTSRAAAAPGVLAVVTGDTFPILAGSVLQDRPPLARGRVRYRGEPVALVVGRTEAAAEAAAHLIDVQYEPLPVVNSVQAALREGAPLVHEMLGQYKRVSPESKPEPGTNIADRWKIRKGDMGAGWSQSEVIVESHYSLPQSDHVAMETRNARAEILPDGRVVIHTSSQAPFAVKREISDLFNIEPGKVVVHVPLVGGAFGGKAGTQIELLAYIASRSAGGRPVHIADTREEDLISFPVHVGLEARVKLGAARDGTFKAAEITFLVDCGAYADTGPRIAKSMAVDCTGPYRVDNVWCDSLCVYTNHPYGTSFRGFGHLEYAFPVERAIDKLAFALGMDPMELRRKNALRPGDTTPTQVRLTASNLGNVEACIDKVKGLIGWNGGRRVESGGKVRAMGAACFWKTSDTPTDASSGALITFNADGSMNLDVGSVEYGSGSKTGLAQILAAKMGMDPGKVHVFMDVDTQVSPKHWKTVASMTTLMEGRAVLAAAEDAIEQVKRVASAVLRCPTEDLEVGGGRVFVRDDPSFFLELDEIVQGFNYPNGNSVGGQILDRGTFIMRHLTSLDPETGEGKPGPSWTVGAQAVEVEFDKRDFTFKVLKAATVLDAGKVLNPKTAAGVVMGGMSMGLGIATREAFSYTPEGAIENTSLRTYKLIRLGEQPQYMVDFVETPQMDAPFGARGLSEHGTIGIPAAVANAISCDSEVEM
ncbi:MAG: xanthine dehydrogenase family protein molybdopterin-binding subunit, partial [Bacillota bacterium]